MGSSLVSRARRTLVAVTMASLVATIISVPSTAATPTVDAAAKRFAPVLAFDSSQNGYPMDAQVFFDRMLSAKRDGGTITWVGRQADKSLPPPKGYEYSGVPSSWVAYLDPLHLVRARNWYDVVQTTEKRSLNGGTRPTYY
jgi:hypothetical protein